MALSINWETSVITIPKSFLTLVQSTPLEIYNLDLNTFRLALKDLEDSEEGMVFLDTHRHNTEVTLGGLTYARVVEIINGYTITFEDGQYAVNLIGANSNIADVVNVNQVSVRANNSAGLISNPAIEYSSFQNAVHIDVTSNNTGTVYPTGTRQRPVNNLADALLIASYRGFTNLFLLSDITITSGQNIDELTLISDNWLSVTVESGVSLVNTNFEKVSLYGVMGGFWNICIDCWIYDITNFCGWMRGGSFVSIALAPYTVESNGQSFFDYIVPMYPGVPSVLTMNTDVSVSFSEAVDVYQINSMTSGSTLSFGLAEGILIIDSSCVGGSIVASGIGILENYSTGLTINTDGLISKDTITSAVYDEVGEEIQFASYNNGITIDVINGTDSSVFPYGSTSHPCKTLTNISEIARDKGFKRIYVIGNLTIIGVPHGILDGYTFIGQDRRNSKMTIDNVQCINCNFENCELDGTFSNSSFILINNSRLSNINNITIEAIKCELIGTIELNDTEPSNFYDCSDGIPGTGVPVILTNDCEALGFWNYSGGLKLQNITSNTSVSINFNSGRLILDSSCVNGAITVRGIGSLIDNSNGTTVDSVGLIDNSSITNYTWDAQLSNYPTAGSAGKALSLASTGGVDIQLLVDGVWNEAAHLHRVDGSFGQNVGELVPIMKSVLGLVQHNFKFFDQSYNANGDLTMGKIRIFDSAADCDMNINPIGEYAVSAIYNDLKKLVDYKVKSLI